MKIDAEKKLTYNCDPAMPQNIDFTWLEKNPGKLFNTPLVLDERQMMLENKRNSSCEQNCFKAEDLGVASPRIIRQGYVKSHTNIVANPEIIDLTIGSDCNLTCSYCCKEYSSAWRNDLLANGDYSTVKMGANRWTIDTRDLVISRNSQPVRTGAKHFQLLLDEMKLLSKTLKTLVITGGEPFLNNSLLTIIEKVKSVPDIKIFSGLGVDYKRFNQILDKLKKYTNVRIAISAETLGKMAEFNRYGINYDDFSRKLDLLEEKNIKYIFHSTLSNLTIFDFPNFYNRFKYLVEEYDLVYQPEFMSIYVIDPKSKDKIKEQLSATDFFAKDKIIQSLDLDPTQEQIRNLKMFLTEFTRRRSDLNIDIYPRSFLDWITANA
jgi:organic radical activating enzyme